MRLTSDFFVSALVRSVFGAGGYATVLRRGATEAGAVFVVSRQLNTGETSLYGPAPQASYEEDRPSDRRFQLLAALPDQAAIDSRLERELRFDSDLWIVEIEPASDDIAAILTLAKP